MPSSSKETVRIQVADINGRIVYKTEGPSRDNYVFGNEFATGIYFVEVKSRDGGVVVKKFFRY